MRIKIRKNQIKYYLISVFLLGVLSITTVYAINTVADGFRVFDGNQETIDAHGECEKVTNNNAKDIFVPTRTIVEWQKFRDNATSVALEECCATHDSSTCYSNDVYWYDSCGIREDKRTECGALGCSGSTCNTCATHDHKECVGGDVYWFDSCGTQEELFDDCDNAHEQCNFGACMAVCGTYDFAGCISVPGCQWCGGARGCALFCF